AEAVLAVTGLTMLRVQRRTAPDIRSALLRRPDQLIDALRRGDCRHVHPAHQRQRARKHQDGSPHVWTLPRLAAGGWSLEAGVRGRARGRRAAPPAVRRPPLTHCPLSAVHSRLRSAELSSSIALISAAVSTGLLRKMQFGTVALTMRN